MGPCLSSKGIKDPSQIQQSFKHDRVQDQQIKTIQPLPSTLFNILRKNKDTEIIHPSKSGNKIIQGSSNPAFSELSISDLKMLYAFKTVLWIGDMPQDSPLLNSQINTKNLYLISQNFAQKFIRNYPIFSASRKSAPQTATVPLLVFNNHELLHDKKPNLQIFIHSSKHKNQAIYKQLNINNQVTQTQNENSSQVVDKLVRVHGDKIVFIHSASRSQTDILSILTQYILKLYKTNQITTKIYLKRFLPQSHMTDDEPLNISAVSPNIKPRVSTKQQKGIQQQQQELIRKLHSEIGGSEADNKIERSYNLLVTLLTNIYSNRESQNYRKVKKTNKQINDLLGKYKNGVKLLKVNGFQDQNGFYANHLDGKYLKIYRTDLDLAYRRFIDSKKK